MVGVKPLNPESLYTACDPDEFPFQTTAELHDLKEIIGQDRALDALRFGVGIQKLGFNLFVLGPSGIGKQTMVRNYLEQEASSRTTPRDWCYVNNFDHSHKPHALALPAGRGQELCMDMEQLVDDLRTALPVAFESEEYHARIKEIEEEYEHRREQVFKDLSKEAESHGITLLRTPRGFAFAAVRNGEVISPGDYEKLPEEKRRRIEEVVAILEEKLNSIIRQTPQLTREARNKIKELNREMAMFSVDNLIEEIRKKYADMPPVLNYFDAVRRDVIEHLDEFRSREEGGTVLGVREEEPPSFRRYQVNVLVDHSQSHGASIIYEDSPTYQNLIGRIEHLSQMGTLVTDFMLIKPGALHQAIGGYLILDAVKVLTQPFSWEGLKRALYARQIRIQSLGELYGLVSTVSLEPEPIPLDLKVVLIGNRLLYYLLLEYDPDFQELFKVEADFEEHMERSHENYMLYAHLIATLARKEDMLPFSRHAVARIIEHSSRLAGDASKLTAHMLSIADLMRESDYWAREANAGQINRSNVQQAIDTQIHRQDRIRATLYEQIQRAIILIDTDGEATGQINGLAVFHLGKFSFAQPTRISATARLGEGEFVDIEREIELGGAIHTKGVLILSSFLAARYAKNRPLSLRASLTFEQTYGMVDGDSASVAELCALLSVLADRPIRQWLSVTGSVNQAGQVQAIGGVNEKIEGFFDICQERGLNGRQGVLIPASNVTHLMLRQDVVETVQHGRFHIYPLDTVDQAIELLTGVPAGEPDADGRYPEDSINGLVETRLIELATCRERFARAGREPAGP